MTKQYTPQTHTPVHPAPTALAPNQPIKARDYVTYQEWSYGEWAHRFPHNDQVADVLVGRKRTRYPHWYVSGGRGFHVSKDVLRTDPDYSEKYLKISPDEIVRFVPKADVIE